MIVFLLILILLAVLALTEVGRAIIIAAGVAIVAVAGAAAFAALLVADWIFNIAPFALIAGGLAGYLAYALARSETTGWVCGIAGFAISAVLMTKSRIAELSGKLQPPRPNQARRSRAFRYGYRGCSWIAELGRKLKQPPK